MNKLLCLIIALFTITTSMAQLQLTEISGLVRHNSNIDGNPLRIESEIGENWNSIDNVNGSIGYWGVFSNHQDMDFGTEGGNTSGRVHLVIEAVPQLTVASNGDVGLGTQTPSEKLDVNGKVKIRNVEAGTGDYVMIDSDGVLVRSSPAPLNEIDELYARIAKMEKQIQSLLDNTGN